MGNDLSEPSWLDDDEDAPSLDDIGARLAERLDEGLNELGDSSPGFSARGPEDRTSAARGRYTAAARSALPHKGLKNDVGENNCFLNVVVEALWHLAPFRDAFGNFDARCHACSAPPRGRCA